MSDPSSRRGFLRGLTTLPLIGGGVTLIGAPTAAAEPITRRLLHTYSEWLRVEQIILHEELFAQEEPSIRPYRRADDIGAAREFHMPRRGPNWRELTQPSSRAALVLSTVGCDWREGGR